MDKVAVRVRIAGRVQGVGFRYWALDRARALHLSGWVRNRRDGTVEALFSGRPEAVNEMVASCRDGPPGARVIGVDSFPADPPDESGFQQLPTE